MSYIIEAFEDYQKAHDINSLWNSFKNRLEKFGVTNIGYVCLSSKQSLYHQSPLSNETYISNYPEDYERYINKNYINMDGVIYALRYEHPMLYHLYPEGILNENQLKIRKETFDFLGESGVTIPTRFNFCGIGGFDLALSMTNTKEFDKIWKYHHLEITNNCHMFDELFRSSLIEGIYPISQREKEILTLLSSGLARKKIADKLGTSVYTVNNQVYNARRKLHAHNDAQAITKALVFNLISP